jgi:hypothetical protein
VILGAISFAIFACYRFKKRNRRIHHDEEPGGRLHPPNEPLESGRLHPPNEPLESGRLGNEINAKAGSGLTVTQNDVSEGKSEPED